MTKSNSTAIAVKGESALEAFRPILDTLPGLEDDPTPRMMELILNCQSPAEWESVFRARGLKDSNGERFRIHAVRWSQSQFEESRTGIFLICDVTNLRSGERDVLTVGGDMAMAQVLSLVAQGNLPWDVEVKQKDKPTRAGYLPIHLVSLGRPAGEIE